MRLSPKEVVDGVLDLEKVDQDVEHLVKGVSCAWSSRSRCGASRERGVACAWSIKKEDGLGHLLAKEQQVLLQVDVWHNLLERGRQGIWSPKVGAVLVVVGNLVVLFHANFDVEVLDEEGVGLQAKLSTVGLFGQLANSEQRHHEESSALPGAHHRVGLVLAVAATRQPEGHKGELRSY